MIRSCTLILLAWAFSSTNGQGNVDTRLGLLAPGLGLPPVPGASNPNPGSIANLKDFQCKCLPPNQACTVDNVQLSNNPFLTIINTRIVNSSPGRKCPGNDQLCCPGKSQLGIIPTPNESPRQPTIISSSTCGLRKMVYPPKGVPTPVADFGEYPWMALVLELDDSYIGGGVLVSKDIILTAAHKVVGKSNIKVRLGEHDVTKREDNSLYPHQDIRVASIIIHPQYEPGTLLNDVAILKLPRGVNTLSTPHIGTVCLPEFMQVFNGQRCYVTGYGTSSFVSGSYQNILKEVDVTVIDPFRCEAQLRNTRLGSTFELDTTSFLCAGGEVGKDACTGDGGSPLVCGENGKWTLVGLVAWGIECAKAEIPGVYVNIASFVPFIRQYL